MSNTLSATFTPVDYSLHDIRFTTGRILRVGFISKVFDFMPDGTPIIFTPEQTSRYTDRYHNTYLDGEYQMKFEVQFCFFADRYGVEPESPDYDKYILAGSTDTITEEELQELFSTRFKGSSNYFSSVAMTPLLENIPFLDFSDNTPYDGYDGLFPYEPLEPFTNSGTNTLNYVLSNKTSSLINFGLSFNSRNGECLITITFDDVTVNGRDYAIPKIKSPFFLINSGVGGYFAYTKCDIIPIESSV